MDSRQGRRLPRSAAEAKTALFARRSESRAGRAGERYEDDELLQPSLRGDARMEALARLIARLSALPVSTPLVNLFDLVDASALPSLGEQFHVMGVEGWNLATSIDAGGAGKEIARRELLKKAIELHRHKGTPWAVEEALRTLIGRDASVSEWFEYSGEPYFFRVGFDVSASGFQAALWPDLFAAIMAWKNARSWLEGVWTYDKTPMERVIATGLRAYTESKSRLWFTPPVIPETRISRAPGSRAWTETRLRLHFRTPAIPETRRISAMGATSLTSTRVALGRAA